MPMQGFAIGDADIDLEVTIMDASGLASVAGTTGPTKPIAEISHPSCSPVLSLTLSENSPFPAISRISLTISEHHQPLAVRILDAGAKCVSSAVHRLSYATSSDAGVCVVS